MRRAVAIQLIINRELGLNFCENPWQGSFIIDKLTDIVEEAVYKEFEAISERGGVLGAMDTMYQRGKIQEESMYYEHKKHDGSLPLIGVNTFLPKEHAGDIDDDDRTDPLDRRRERSADRQRRSVPRQPQSACHLSRWRERPRREARVRVDGNGRQAPSHCSKPRATARMCLRS